MEYIKINKKCSKINVFSIFVIPEKPIFSNKLWFKCGLEGEDYMKKTPLKRKTKLKSYTKLKSRKPMNKISKKQRKKEASRYSVFYQELDKCCYCGSFYKMTKHEIFEGRNRTNSIKYGYVLPLCLKCHQRLQEDKEFNDHWKKKAQMHFEEHTGTREQFMEIFKRNYL